MTLEAFRITRFQFARDRVIGDSQVRADDANVAALELISKSGAVGLGFIQTLFTPLPVRTRLPEFSLAKSGPQSKVSRQLRSFIGRAGRRRESARLLAALPRSAAGGALGSRREGGGSAAA